MDSTDIKILKILQVDGRISMKDLGRQVNLTSPAVSERVRRLEEKGIIRGYTAIVDPKKLHKTVSALINVAMKVSSHEAFIQLAKDEPSIIECHHMTGTDCMTVKVLVDNTEELEDLLDRIQTIGDTRTSIILSSPLERKPILP